MNNEQNNKNYFVFGYFDQLQVGDVFKFSQILDDDMPNSFFTVYYKDDEFTKINSTYGKLDRKVIPSNSIREVMIFESRKR